MITICNDYEDLKNILSNNKDKTIIIDTYAKWCQPCKKISPFFENLSNDQLYKNVVFVKIDIDNATNIQEYLDPEKLPTFYIFKNLMKIDEYTGSNEEQLKNFLNKYK